MKKPTLSLTESSDFQYLLELMVPLYEMPEYAWLPELFSVIGHEDLIKLCQICGGETIRIPTIQELASSIEALEWFYNIQVTKKKRFKSVPDELKPTVVRIKEIIDAGNSKGNNQKSTIN